MPKAPKERVKHSASLTAQIQNDEDPQLSVSKRSNRKRKVEDEEESEEKGEKVIEGKLGQQILTMAREQLDDDQDDESEETNEMRWRETRM